MCVLIGTPRTALMRRPFNRRHIITVHFTFVEIRIDIIPAGSQRSSIRAFNVLDVAKIPHCHMKSTLFLMIRRVPTLHLLTKRRFSVFLDNTTVGTSAARLTKPAPILTEPPPVWHRRRFSAFGSAHQNPSVIISNILSGEMSRSSAPTAKSKSVVASSPLLQR